MIFDFGLGVTASLFVFVSQCCGAGAESREAEIKLPPGARAEIMNCGWLKNLKKFYM
jgi:hypothetical protein